MPSPDKNNNVAADYPKFSYVVQSAEVVKSVSQSVGR